MTLARHVNNALKGKNRLLSRQGDSPLFRVPKTEITRKEAIKLLESQFEDSRLVTQALATIQGSEIIQPKVSVWNSEHNASLGLQTDAVSGPQTSEGT